MSGIDFSEDIILENDYVLLRPIVIEDIDNLLEIALSEVDLLQYSPKPIHSITLLINYIKHALDEREKQLRYSFIVFDKKNQKYAGSTSFLKIHLDHNKLEIGATWYGREFRNTFININCKFLLLQYVFEHLCIKRVTFKTDERNLASNKALKKIGAIYEGTLRKDTVLYSGFTRSTSIYSILKEEWFNEVKLNLENKLNQF